MKLGSLFDGIGGFPLSATYHGIEPVWASEIEPFPIEVTRQHFPKMKHLGDITQINGAEIEPVDIITFGSPCQDLSVAGKRDGLEGKRSNLFYQAVRIIREMREATNGIYPRIAVWENVPGAFSSNKGQDIQAVLDLLQDSGYVLDMNVLDAQYMGVPQRRKRVFIVCVSLSSLPKMRTILSEQISTGLVVTLLQKSWADIQEALAAERSPLDYGRKTEQFATSLQKKMNLLKREMGEQPLLKLLGNLAEHRQPSEIGESNFLGVTSDSSKQSHLSTQAGAEKYRLKTLISEAAIGTESMFMLSNKILVEASQQKKSSTISTLISETMRETIFTCSQTVLNMARLMVVCEDWQKIYYEQVSSILTVMKECISYAKQASGNLLEPMEWVERWHDYISAASDCREQIERHLAGRSGQEVFPISESVPRNPAESGEAGEEVAGSAGDGVTESVFYESGPGWISEGFGCLRAEGENRPSRPTHTVVARTVSAKWAKGYRMTAFGEYADDDTASAMKARDYKDATDLVAVEKLYDMTHADEVIRECEPGVSPTLNARMGTGDNQIPIRLHKSFTPSQFGQYQEGCGTLRANGGDLGGGSENLVSNNYTVRRLTPTECERLQGFPPVMEVRVSEMTRDEYIAYNLAAGNISVDFETGQVFAFRGPGGRRLAEPIALDGTVMPSGYRVVSIRCGEVKKQCRINRVVWIAANGVPPDGMVVDHINNVKLDNSLSNLQLLTPKENSTKAKEDGCYLTGDDNPQTKIGEETAMQICDDYKHGEITMRSLAEKYGISKSRVHQIIHSKDWTNIPGASDTGRYKALGNSVAVPCVSWIIGRVREALVRANLPELIEGEIEEREEQSE